MTTPLIAQLRDELGDRFRALAAILGDPDSILKAELDIERASISIQWALISEDDAESAQAVIDLMAALWPEGIEPPASWWRTPLGIIAARSTAIDGTEAVTHSVAASMLGVTRGAIGGMIQRGDLDRHPDGGVLRSSVHQRIERQRSRALESDPAALEWARAAGLDALRAAGRLRDDGTVDRSVRGESSPHPPD